MVDFRKFLKKFKKKKNNDQPELSGNPKREFGEDNLNLGVDNFDASDLDPEFDQYWEGQSSWEWFSGWTEWLYYTLDEWIGWSSWRVSFSFKPEKPEKDLTPAERKANEERRKAEARRKQLESAKLRRNQQLRNQILDEKRIVEREEEKCLEWKQLTDSMLDQKLSEAKNVFFDPDSDYLSDPRWRMRGLDKKAAHQNLCELLLCVQETSCSSPLGSSMSAFETEIKRPSMTPPSDKESFVSFQKDKQLLETQEKLVRVQEALKVTSANYEKCLAAYQDLFGTCKSRDYNRDYNPDYSNPSVSLALPGFRAEREEGNSNSNPNRPKPDEEFNSPERETGRYWNDVGRNLLTLPVVLFQHPEILNLAAKRRKPILNAISAIVHLSISVVVLVFYIGVAVILMSIIINMVNMCFAYIRLVQARYRRKLELAYQELEKERTRVRGSKLKYVEAESDIDSEEYDEAWVRKRKKKSAQFWEKRLGWLARKIFRVMRGGALVPLATVDMYSVTESDRQFILWQVGPERHIIQLEKQMRELLTRVEKDLLPELTRVENELLQEMTQVEKEDDPSKKWKDRFRFFQFLKLKKGPRLSAATLSTVLGVVVFFGMLTSVQPIHTLNQMDLQTDQPITSVLVNRERQVELEESLVEDFKNEESLVLQQRQTSGRRREQKWNRKIRTLKDLPPLEEDDFGEEIPEESCKLSSFAKSKKIKIRE